MDSLTFFELQLQIIETLWKYRSKMYLKRLYLYTLYEKLKIFLFRMDFAITLDLVACVRFKIKSRVT